MADIATGLKHRWKLDETTGTDFVDDVGGITLTGNGVMPSDTVEDGRHGSAIRRTSLADYAQSASANFTLNASQFNAVNYWFRTSANAGSGNHLFSTRSSQVPTTGSISIMHYSGGLYMFYGTAQQTLDASFVTNHSINGTGWHLLTVCMKHDTADWRWWVDGGTAVGDVAYSGVFTTTTWVELFGSTDRPDHDAWVCDLDDVRVYKNLPAVWSNEQQAALHAYTYPTGNPNLLIP